MILGWHLVAHVPVNLPAATDWKTWIVIYVDILFFSDRVSARYVADIVVEVEVLDVPGVLGRDHLHAVLSVALLVEINAVELALKVSTDILQLEVLVHPDETPMAHVNRFASPSQDKLRVRGLEQQLDQVKTVRLGVLIWPVPHASLRDLGSIPFREHFWDTRGREQV